MSPDTAKSWAMLAVIGGESIIAWHNLRSGSFGSARQYIAVGVGGAAALLLVGISPPLSFLMSFLLLAVVAYRYLGQTTAKKKG